LRVKCLLHGEDNTLSESPTKSKDSPGIYETTVLFIFFLVSISIIILFLISSVPKDVADKSTIHYDLFMIPYSWDLEKNMHLVLIVVYGGALGGLIHGLSSLASHSHTKTLTRSFYVWYISRPFLGAALALAVYFAFRGGIITNGGVDVLNPYGIASISIIVGLGTKRITDKLRDLFEALLK